MLKLQNTAILTFALLTPAWAAGGPNCSSQQGQNYIDAGLYRQALREFSCLIDANPAAIEGYRGRIEARLLLGEYSEALSDNARITAYVLPANPGAKTDMIASYTARLKSDPSSIPALTGASFARWTSFDYAQAIQLLNKLLAVAPGNLYGALFRGSTRMLSGANSAQGIADLERAIRMAPGSPDVRFIAADAYTYGVPDPQRAFTEANLALQWGLDTPRIRAILAVCHQAFGNSAAAAAETRIHIDQVTSQTLAGSVLAPGASYQVPLVPGRTYEFPVPVGAAGDTLSITTSSRDFYDTILVLLDPNGVPVAASDDYVKYFAGLDWTAGSAGTYRLRVTSFESIDTGMLVVSRK